MLLACSAGLLAVYHARESVRLRADQVASVTRDSSVARLRIHQHTADGEVFSIASSGCFLTALFAYGLLRRFRGLVEADRFLEFVAALYVVLSIVLV